LLSWCRVADSTCHQIFWSSWFGQPRRQEFGRSLLLAERCRCHWLRLINSTTSIGNAVDASNPDSRANCCRFFLLIQNALTEFVLLWTLSTCRLGRSCRLFQSTSWSSPPNVLSRLISHTESVRWGVKLSGIYLLTKGKVLALVGWEHHLLLAVTVCMNWLHHWWFRVGLDTSIWVFHFPIRASRSHKRLFLCSCLGGCWAHSSGSCSILDELASSIFAITYGVILLHERSSLTRASTSCSRWSHAVLVANTRIAVVHLSFCSSRLSPWLVESRVAALASWWNLWTCLDRVSSLCLWLIDRDINRGVCRLLHTVTTKGWSWVCLRSWLRILSENRALRLLDILVRACSFGKWIVELHVAGLGCIWSRGTHLKASKSWWFFSLHQCFLWRCCFDRSKFVNLVVALSFWDEMDQGPAELWVQVLDDVCLLRLAKVQQQAVLHLG